ncbi:MAG: sugar phosphate isomerase/epimerase [Spirochaetaceae bacterium]|nr:MAG: sugar phosphate isomerase/epimerase [Spirochaetaceae bacterium]
MKRKIGVLIDNLLMPFDEALVFAAGLGVEGIQFYASRDYVAPWRTTPARRAEIEARISDAGLQVCALCGDLGGHGFERRSEHEQRLLRTRQIIEYAAELGTGVVSSHIGVIPPIRDEVFGSLVDALQSVVRFAEQHGVRYAIETGPEPSRLLKQFIDEIGSPGLAVNFDPANLIMVHGENAVSATEILAPHIAHVHAKDGRRLQPCDAREIYGAFAEGNPRGIDIDSFFVELPPGEGDVGFTAWVDALDRIGYQGFLTIEREAGDRRASDVEQAVRFLRDL